MEIKTITKQQATSSLPANGEFVLVKGVKKSNWKALPRDIQQVVDFYIGTGTVDVILRKS